MIHDQHVKYVEDVTGLADERGKDVSGAFLADVKKLLKKSRGNLDVFREMLRVGREVMIKRMILKAGRATLEAKKIGKEFGEKKLGNV